MPDLNRYETQFRPKSYFVTDTGTALIARIKGAVRRDVVRQLGRLGVDEALRAESLTDQHRQASGRIHPSLMGGEYLPDLAPEQVEIARIELESVTADVISLRARWSAGKIRYELVDEYETDYEISPAESDEPLTFSEVIRLIDGEGLTNRVRNMNYGCKDSREAAERLAHFVCVSSEFYPELLAYYDDEAREWLAERLAELGGENLERDELA